MAEDLDENEELFEFKINFFFAFPKQSERARIDSARRTSSDRNALSLCAVPSCLVIFMALKLIRE